MFPSSNSLLVYRFQLKKATQTVSLHIVQNCDGLDSDQSFDVTVYLRQCHSLDFDIFTVWLRESRYGLDSLTAE